MWKVKYKENNRDVCVEFYDKDSALSFAECLDKENITCWVSGPNGENPTCA